MEWLHRRGARRQFEEFVGGAARGLARTAYLMTWDLAESEDLVQETFLQVARRWDRVRTMDQPLAYARRILVNQLPGGIRVEADTAPPSTRFFAVRAAARHADDRRRVDL